MLPPGQPARLARTECHDIRGADGRLRRVFLHVPEGPAPEGGWPSLWMTDGNAVVGTAVEALRVRALWPEGSNVGPGVLVALGYPVEAPYDHLLRARDLSPPPGRLYPPFTEGGPEVRTGGADAFAEFIEAQVMPFVAARVPLDRARRTLFGHSFGGLFALHTLFTRPHAFRNWVAASPSIFWEEGALLTAFERFRAAPPPGLDAVVHLSAGEWEGAELAPFRRAAADAEARRAEQARARTLEAAREMAGALAATPGLAPRFEVFAGETHMSVLPVAVGRAVDLAFALSR
ncbi:alpha/beta hydrolase [Oceanicella sp. SM1341]|uniref:alpha/beta hydrolase n=1 Tax=Oceanicella sp. SM1341 TaxID=1548889 RepID=UPI000E49A341|nr:alpha/beta hydrolase-fold protein [Oceanicella sp. SM1341]